jgi:hypothetical protein
LSKKAGASKAFRPFAVAEGGLRESVAACFRLLEGGEPESPPERGPDMQAITVRDRATGVGDMSLTELPYPHLAENDVIVRVHAAGFTRGELTWLSTWTDRGGRDRTPTVPGHDLSGVVTELGYGTTGLSVGQRVFGLVDWARDGSLAEYTAVEARNLAPLPADVDHTVAAALPISGLTGRPCSTTTGFPRGRPSWSTGPRAVWGRSRCSSHVRLGPG